MATMAEKLHETGDKNSSEAVSHAGMSPKPYSRLQAQCGDLAVQQQLDKLRFETYVFISGLLIVEVETEVLKHVLLQMLHKNKTRWTRLQSNLGSASSNERTRRWGGFKPEEAQEQLKQIMKCSRFDPGQGNVNREFAKR